MNEARSLYWTRLINENSHDQHKLFKTVNSLLSDSKSLLLPANVSLEIAPNNIGNYLVQKVNDIYDHLVQNNTVIIVHPDYEVSNNITPLLHFKELTMDEVRAIINKTSKKGCSLGPLPTSLFLQCLDNLLPTITTMLNLSLQIGHFLDS